MSEQDRHSPPNNGVGGPTPRPAAPTGHGFFWKTWQVLKVAQARLRFIAILAVIGTVIGSWDTLAAYYAKWTRPLYGQQTDAAASDVEYFCPMHPFIVRDNPKEKCPICHMDLAKRKKGAGEAEPLPPGTVSRVQLSPYRMVLAGVETTEVRPMPLTKEVTTFGTVEFNETKEANISAQQKARIVKLFVNYTGQKVEKGEKLAVLDVRYNPELTVTLDDLSRARQRGDRAAEDMARQRLKLWDVGDGQIDEFLKTGKVGTELTVTSPIKGHVVKKYQREGSFVDEGTPLYDIVDLDSVWIEAEVYEADQALAAGRADGAGDDPRPARRGLRGQTRLRLPAPGRGQPDPDGALRHPQPRPPAAARHVHDRQDRRAADEDRPARRGRGRGLGGAERGRRPGARPGRAFRRVGRGRPAPSAVRGRAARRAAAGAWSWPCPTAP